MTVVVYKLSEIVTGKMTSCVQIVRNCGWENDCSCEYFVNILVRNCDWENDCSCLQTVRNCDLKND